MHLIYKINSQKLVEKKLKEELAEEIISLIHSFSWKLYWLRKKIKDGNNLSWETSN